MNLTKQRVEEMSKRAEMAAKGPWETDTYATPGEISVCGQGCIIVTTSTNPRSCDPKGQAEHQINDTNFITHARTDIPDLLADRKVLEELLEASNKAIGMLARRTVNNAEGEPINNEAAVWERAAAYWCNRAKTYERNETKTLLEKGRE